jgi:hypothetical protein
VYCWIRRVTVMASIILVLGVGGLSMEPTRAEAAPLDQYGCWGGPCSPAPAPWASPPPGPWGGPPAGGSYADAVVFTDYVNLTNAIGYQNVVNVVTYRNLANAAAYRNAVRVATYEAAVRRR